jgi:hypothetical protein
MASLVPANETRQRHNQQRTAWLHAVLICMPLTFPDQHHPKPTSSALHGCMLCAIACL